MKNLMLAAAMIMGCSVMSLSQNLEFFPEDKGEKSSETIKVTNTKTLSDAGYECIYDYTVNNPAKGDTIKERTACVLQIGSSMARFLDYTAYSTDSAMHCATIDEDAVKKLREQELKNVNYFEEIVYQNYPRGKNTVSAIITPNYYVYEEDARPIEWELEEEIDTVCGYECFKATGAYGGRSWTVWYAPEIPVPYGPWKLTGLPGLVLAARDAEGLHVFRAISFRKSDMPIYEAERPHAVKISRDKFVKQKNSFENAPNPINNIPVESIGQISVTKTGEGVNDAVISINGVALRARANGYVAREVK